MLDIQQLRADLDGVAAALAKRGKPIDFTAFSVLEAERKTLQTRTQELQAQRNTLSKQIGQLKSQGQDASAVLAEVGALGDELKASESRLSELLNEFNALLAGLPNIPDPSVPVGADESANVEVKRWGTPRVFDFPVKDHTDVGEALGQLDFATAAKISGARFSLLKGGIARLHRALAQFMLDTHTAEHGYTELYAPYLVNAASLYGTGQLPKFEEDLFKVLRGEQDGYRCSLAHYRWGSNMYLLNNTMALLMANDVQPNERYLLAARSHLNYILGANPLGINFVTGVDETSPQNPHHRPSAAAGLAMPGMLVGGPDEGLHDLIAKTLLSGKPAAERYIDSVESYSTNEVAIYWNSVLIYVLARMSKLEA